MNVDLTSETLTIRGVEYYRLPDMPGIAARWGRELDYGFDTYVDLWTPYNGAGKKFFAETAIRVNGDEDLRPLNLASQGRTPEEAIDGLLRVADEFVEMIEKSLGGKR